MEAKKTKGRQKREIKKIENEKDLLTTFTKRKAGIYKKANELTTLCGAQVDILMFSPSGKSFCFGEPSLQSTTKCPSNQQHPSQCGIYQLVEDYRRMEIEELNGKNDVLMDQMYVEKERDKKLGEILKTRNSCGWWEAKMEELSYEQAKEMEASLMELQKKLETELSMKCGQNASLAPIDQTNGVNPYPNYASGSNMPEVAFGANNEAYGIEANQTNGVNPYPNYASGSNIPEVAFGANSEAYGIFGANQTNGVNPYPTYASGSNMPEVAFGANNEAYGIGATTTDQTNGVNPYPTYARASNMPEVAFGVHNEACGIDATPIDQINGVNPYPTYASGSNMPEVAFGANDEAYGIGASESILPDFSFSPTSEEQTFNLIPSHESVGDISDIVFPPINQAQETNLFLDDPNGSGESIFASFPINQAQRVNLTDASGSGSHALAF